MPRASSRSSSSASASCVGASLEIRAAPPGSCSKLPSKAQLQRERHEPLLGAVVQVALQPPALGVAGLHDARARARELLVGVGVGQRLGDELGEVAQPMLGPGGAGSRTVGRGDEHTPQPPAD